MRNLAANLGTHAIGLKFDNDAIKYPFITIRYLVSVVNNYKNFHHF